MNAEGIDCPQQWDLLKYEIRKLRIQNHVQKHSGTDTETLKKRSRK